MKVSTFFKSMHNKFINYNLMIINNDFKLIKKYFLGMCYYVTPKIHQRQYSWKLAIK